jgi:hypothetical protein
MQYFVPVKKPVPPVKGMAGFLLYVDELSVSWDNLHADRMKAREAIIRGLSPGKDGD